MASGPITSWEIDGKQWKQCLTISTVSPFTCHEVMGPDAIILVFWMLSFKPAFLLSSSLSSGASSVTLHFLPLEWYHLNILDCWYFSQQSWFHLLLHPARHFAWSTQLLLLLSHFSRVWLYATPKTAAHQAPPSLGFSRQEHWSELPFLSLMHESEKWSHSVVSDS